MVLVDTSVWIDHLRVGDRTQVRLLEDGEVGVHPLVIGELACGNLRNRRESLALLADLPSVERVSDEEVLFFLLDFSIYILPIILYRLGLRESKRK